jgi:hypothetical protein
MRVRGRGRKKESGSESERERERGDKREVMKEEKTETYPTAQLHTEKDR